MILKPKDVLEKLTHERKCEKNIAVIFFLNKHREIISTHRHIFFEKSQLKMSDIFIPAFYVSASFLILAHIKNRENHKENLEQKEKLQTNSLQPTQFEKELTNKVITAGNFLNIKLLDHLIVTKKTYYSFHESGII